MNKNYILLNNKVNQKDKDGSYINLDLDKQAVKEYFLENINKNTVFFHNLKEKLDYLVKNGYYDKTVLDKYSYEEIKEIFKIAYEKKFRFRSFMGAKKFYESYALKDYTGEKYLERYEDRLSMIALTIANDFSQAKDFIKILINQELQPATPVTLNSGLLNGGRKISCFLIDTCDNLESIGYVQSSVMKLSALGGGLSVNLSRLRARGEKIRGVENRASGVMPVAKIIEDTLEYANQGGARMGSGVVSLSIFHSDIQEFINSKKINADEKVRLKTLSIAVVVPDKFFELLKDTNDRHFYTFYPHNVFTEYGIELVEMDMSEWYDKLVKNPNIKKKSLNKMDLVNEILNTMKQSGYPYLTFIDTMNKQNPNKRIGKIYHSNLCQEISQLSETTGFENTPYSNNSNTKFGNDVQCVLGSLNLVNLIENGNFEETVKNSIKFLSNVSDLSNIKEVPSMENANKYYHSIGLGALNLQGLLVKNNISYDSEQAKELTNIIFTMIRYYAIKSSMEIAREKGEVFKDFDKSEYCSGEIFEKYINNDLEVKYNEVKNILKDIKIITKEDWKELKEEVKKYGIYNAYLSAVAPNQSSAYIMEATPSIIPVSDIVEVREYGNSKTIYPQPYLSNENIGIYKNAYELDQKKMIDLISIIQEHTDQAISFVHHINSDTTKKEMLSNIIYAWQKGLKTVYYTRTRKQSIMQDKEPVCESCSV